MATWGFHCILDIKKCIPVAIRSKNVIRNFSKELVNRIDMVPFGRPQIVMFGDGNKKGYTLVQLIETSNITAHFVEETNDIYLDIFSCKKFNPLTVEEVVHSYFEPDKIKSTFILR